jgi:hypothetical protein
MNGYVLFNLSLAVIDLAMAVRFNNVPCAFAALFCVTGAALCWKSSK